MVRDAALSSGDHQAYRSIKEGFYCDVLVDADREALAKKMVASPQEMRSTLLETHDLGIQNYRAAIVVFEQNSGDETTTLTGLVDRYPAGWRFRWIDDEW